MENEPVPRIKKSRNVAEKELGPKYVGFLNGIVPREDLDMALDVWQATGPKDVVNWHPDNPQDITDKLQRLREVRTPPSLKIN